LTRKIEALNQYFDVTEKIYSNEYSDTTRSEITNLDKNFLDSVNAHDWELAKEFLKRIKTVSYREKDSRYTAAVSSNEKTE